MQDNKIGMRELTSKSLFGRMTNYIVCFAVAWLQIAPAYAQVAVATTGNITATTLATPSAGVTDVTTTTIVNSTAYNNFEKFNVGAGTTVNLIEPSAATALVNVVNDASGAPTTIDGIVNGVKEGGVGSSNVYILDHNGFVVTSNGSINAQKLTLSTATQSYGQGVLSEALNSSGTSVTQLFAGTEPLAGANIDIYGDINATRLDLRAGARMIIDGNITVQDTDTADTTISVVNTDGVAQATGVTVDGGVIRFGAGGPVTVKKKIKVRRGTTSQTGGQAVIKSGGDLTIEATGMIDADGEAANDAGSVLLFVDGSTVMQAGAKITAKAIAGDGGFVFSQSGTAYDSGAGTFSATLQGELSAGSDTGTAGAAYVRGDGIQIAGDLSTFGGDLVVYADEKIELASNADLSTRNIAVGGSHATAASTGASGDVIISARDIELKSGSNVFAQSGNADEGGLVALIARNTINNNIWSIGTDASNAKISLDTSAIKAGTIVINAVAIASNVVGSADLVEEAQQLDDLESSFEADPTAVEATLDSLAGVVQSVLDKGVDTVAAKLPIQVNLMQSTADISITDSTLTADGNWKNKGAVLAVTTPSKIDNGMFLTTGLAEGTLSSLDINGIDYKTLLPSEFDTTNDSIYIQGHSETEVTVAPLGFALGLSVSVTKAQALVKITDSMVSSTAGDISVRSTVSENLNVTIAPTAISGFSVGVIVAVRDIENQTLINGGSINSAAGIDVGAYTAKNHTVSLTANGGNEGKAALAVVVDLGDNLTEAALGGTITAATDLDLKAETLYIGKSHTVSSTMGLKSINSAALERTPVATIKDKAKGIVASLKEKITGKPPADAEVAKPGFGFAASIDVAIERDDTYATLGGQYHDLTNSDALVDLDTTTVSTGAEVDVDAVERFARLDEEGFRLGRNVKSKMGALGFLLRKELAIKNAALATQGLDPITEEELVQEFGNAVFTNISVGLMAGETQAEIGGNTTISQASKVSVDALTAYPGLDTFSGFQTDLDAFVTGLKTFKSDIENIQINADFEAPETPEIPDILGYLNPLNFLTSNTAAKAEQPTANPDGSTDADASTSETQKLAVAITANYFQTDNTTRAVIRDGAAINVGNASDVVVNAKETAMFLHLVNMPTANPLKPNENVNDAVGAAVNIVRTISNAEALIENGVTIEARDIVVDAQNSIISGNLVYAGGSAKNISINAAIGAAIVENTTTARVGETAKLTGRDVTIKALDDSIQVGVAGAISGSNNTSVGASANVNFARREVYAGIGPSTDGGVLALPVAADTITANSLTINAENKAIELSITIAGAKVSGKPKDDASNADTDEASEEETIIPSWFFDDDEDFALKAQEHYSTPSDSTGADGATGKRQKAGYAVSGAASLNLMLKNSVVAEIATEGQIDLTGNLTQTAKNTSITIAGAGAVSAGVDKKQNTNALAGSFAISVDERDVESRVRGATITANVIDIQALDKSVLLDVAVGGAGKTKGNSAGGSDKTLALAGSVAVNVVSGKTETTVDGASLTSTTTANLATDDNSFILAVGGAAGINLDLKEGSGVGIGIAVNVVDRTAKTQVNGTSSLAGTAVTASSLSQSQIFGFGVAVGVGKTGVGGSITVNTLDGGAQTILGDAAAGNTLNIKANSLTVTATETNDIWSLAGAIAGGKKTAVGGAITVNNIIAGTKATVQNALVEKTAAADLGAVRVEASSDSNIGTIAAAGAAGGADTTAIGVGLSGNHIKSETNVSLANTTVAQASSVLAKATNERSIRSLGGGVALSGKSAAGFAATINLLLQNDTKVNLDGADISTRAGGDITAEAISDAAIGSLALAVSASKGTSIGGSATVNVTTAATNVTANGATLNAAGGLKLSAKDASDIQSLAGGAAISTGGNGVGAAIAANVISHDTSVEANSAILTVGTGPLDLLANNDADIKSAAVGLAVSTSSNAVSGSIAVGYIGNATRVAAAGTSITAAGQDVTLKATKTSQIDILSGAIAASGSNAVGGAVTVAVIQDTVTSDLVANAQITAGDVDVIASGTNEINAIAVAGGGGSSNAFFGSLVYAQIGKPPSALSTTPSAEDTSGAVTLAEDEGDTQRTDALNAIGERTAFQASTAEGNTNFVTPATYSLDEEDIVRAKVDLTAGNNVTATSLDVRANEDSIMRTLAGAVAVGGSNAGGVAIDINLLFGTTEAALILADGQTTTLASDVNVTSDQVGTIRTLAAAGAGGGSNALAGSIIVNVFDRKSTAKIGSIGSTGLPGSSTATKLATQGGDVVVRATQNDVTKSGTTSANDFKDGNTLTDARRGSIDALAGAIAVGGTAGIGAAVSVSILSDDALAEIANVQVDTSISNPLVLTNAGDITIKAKNAIDLTAIAASVGGGGTAGISGSFAINVANSTIIARASEANLIGKNLTVDANATNALGAYAGALAVGGSAAIGFGIIANVAKMDILSELTATRVRMGENVVVNARAVTGMGSTAIAGGVAGAVSVTGTGAGNASENIVTARVTDHRAGGTPAVNKSGVYDAEYAATPDAVLVSGSDVLARGTAAVTASGETTVQLLGGEDEKADTSTSGGADNSAPSININFSGGGAVGVGATVNVNKTANKITAELSQQSSLIGLGYNAATVNTVNGLVSKTGAYIGSYGKTIITQVAATAVIGGAVGIGATLNFNLVDDEVRTVIGSDDALDASRVNTSTDAAALAYVGASVESSAQNTELSAEILNDITSITVSIAGGGTLGASAASTTNIISTSAEVLTKRAVVNARNDMTVIAKTKNELETWVLGGAGGLVGVGAGVDVNLVSAKSQVNLLGSILTAGSSAAAYNDGNMIIRSDVDTDIQTVVGNIAGGLVGVAGSFIVNVLETESIVNLGAVTSDFTVYDPSYSITTDGTSVAADGYLDIDAQTRNKSNNTAVAAAGGLGAASFGMNIDLIKSKTKVLIAEDQALFANGNLSINATELLPLTGTNVTGRVISAAAGGLAGGAAFNYINYAASTTIEIGDDANINSNASLTIKAEANRQADSLVVGASAGAGAVALGATIIEMGGQAADETDGDLSIKLGKVQADLNKDKGNEGNGGDLLSKSGSATTQSEIKTTRSAVQVNGQRQDDNVKVSIGNNVSLSASQNLSLDSDVNVRLTQVSGNGALGLIGGGSVSVNVSLLKTAAAIEAGNGVTISADGAIQLGATTGGFGVAALTDAAVSGNSTTTAQDNAASVNAKSFAVAGGLLGAGVSGAVVVSKADSTAKISAGNGLRIKGKSVTNAAGVTINASRGDTVISRVANLAVGLGGGVGATVATATSTGRSEVSLVSTTSSTIQATNVSITADDTTTAYAVSESATGGLIGFGTTVATASNTGTSRVNLAKTQIVVAQNVAINTLSSGRALALGRGLSVGLAAVGATIARSTTDITLDADITDTLLFGNDITINTAFADTQGRNSYAKSNSASGGLVAGNGAEATAYLDYNITTDVSGDLTAFDDIRITSAVNGAAAYGEVSGLSVAAVAIGAVFNTAGQTSGKTGTVATNVNYGTLTAGDDIVITSTNNIDVSTKTKSGSGGLVSGAGAEADTQVSLNTSTKVGTTGAATLYSGHTLEVSSSQDSDLYSRLDNTSGSLVGASGATATTVFGSDVKTEIGSASTLDAFNINVNATNSVVRPHQDYNIKSNSGGAIDVAAMVSDVKMNFTTDLNILGNTEITQLGDPEVASKVDIGIVTDIDVTDRLFMDAGGAVAAPIGDSTVDIQSNNSTLNITNASIKSLGELNIYNGGNADLRAEVDTTSYGLAGAAVSNSYALYNANNVININSGTFIEAEGNANILAGYVKDDVQNVKIRAESRTFNKTAIPIPTIPDADAIATTTSRLNINDGAEIIAVRDIYLSAEAGDRDIVGYGRGKDLYREAAAAIASAFSNLVGGDDVSLDIESGRSIDNSLNDGIVVNGKVRAGSRSQRFFSVDQNGNILDTDGNVLTIQQYRDLDDAMEFTLETNVRLSSELQDRINVLNGFINDPLLKQDAAAVAAWNNEITNLRDRQLSSSSEIANKYKFADLTASEGSIFMRADYVQGGNTGELNAPGNAKISIKILSGDILSTNKLYISGEEGGRILLNDVLVEDNNDLRIQSGDRAGPYAINMISGDDAGKPSIDLLTNSLNPNVKSGYIQLKGEVNNLRGAVNVESAQGDIDLDGNISAETISVTAGGDVSIGYVPGVRNIAGSPEAQYNAYFQTQQNAILTFLLAAENLLPTGPVTGLVDYNVATTRIPASQFNVRRGEGILRGGKNVYVTADTLNINGLIQAGSGTFDVTLGAQLNTQLKSGSFGGRRVLIHDTTVNPDGSLAVGDYDITANTNVRVYYNDATNQIEIDDMVVRGGKVRIFGNVISTGYGRIEALDGYGRINITSATNKDVVLNRIDLGDASTGGLAGSVRIEDTAKLTGNNSSPYLITEYLRENGQIKVYTNEGPNGITLVPVYLNDPNGPDANVASYFLEQPNVLKQTINGRIASYAPKANRDLVVIKTQTATRITDQKYSRYYFWIPFGTDSKTTTYKPTSTDTPIDKESAPYIANSLGGADYAYNFTAISTTRTKNTVDDYYYDDNRTLGIGTVRWTDRTTLYAEHRYEHRLKADYSVQIAFSGSDTAALTVNSTGNIILSNTVVNTLGNTSITSTNGNVLTSSKAVTLVAGNTQLSALNGTIGTAGRAFKTRITDIGQLSLAAGSLINIRDLEGKLNLVTATTSQRAPSSGDADIGNITIHAQGDIVDASGNTNATVVGSDLLLISEDGEIGSTANALEIDTQGGGVLTASAKNDIVLTEVAGDLGVNTVTSTQQNVVLNVPDGAVLDRNDVESKDIRTLTQLTALWTDELGLVDGTAEATARADAQVDSLVIRRNEEYRAYWKARDFAGGAAQTFVLDAATEASLRQGVQVENGDYAGGWTDAMVTAYVADMNAVYTVWNAQSAFNVTYDYQTSGDIGTTTEVARVNEDATWTSDQLVRSLNADLVRLTGDTNTRDENANISAFGNITLNTKNGAGELLDPYIIPGTGLGYRLTNLDLEKIYTAEAAEITIGNGQVSIRQSEDLNFAFTGATAGDLTVTSTNSDIFLGAETSAALANIYGIDDVQIKINGALTDNRAAGANQAVTGKIIVLESGNDNSIGTELDPVTVTVLTGGTVTGRSGIDVNIASLTGDLPIAEIFAGGTARLSALGTITDAAGLGNPRLVANNIELKAATIGTVANPFGIQLQDQVNGSVILETTVGDANVKSTGDLRLEKATLAGGGKLTVDTPDQILLVGDDAVTFGTASTLVLDAQAGVVVTDVSGVMFTGGRLVVNTDLAFGTASKSVLTDLTGFEFAAYTPLSTSIDTSIWVEDIGSVGDVKITQNANMMSNTTLVAAGDIGIDTIQSVSTTKITTGGSITNGRIASNRVELVAGGAIGSTSAMDITTPSIVTTSVDATAVNLRDVDTVIDAMTVTGTGALTVSNTNGATIIAAGGTGLTTNSGNISGRFEKFDLNADVTSGGGEINLFSISDFTIADARTISSAGGSQTISASQSLTIGDMFTASTANGDFIVNAGTTLLGDDAAINSGTGQLAVIGQFALTIGENALLETTDSFQGVASRGNVAIGQNASFTNTNGDTILVSLGGNLDIEEALSLTAGTIEVNSGQSATIGENATLTAQTALPGETTGVAINTAIDLTIADNATITSQSGPVAVTVGGNTLIGDALTVASNTGDTLFDLMGTLSLGDMASLDTTTGAISVSVADAATIGANASMTTLGGNISGAFLADLTAGNDLTASTAGGDLTVAVTSDALLGTNASLNSAGGALDVTVGGTFTAGEALALNSDAGTLDLAVTGDTVLADMTSITATSGDITVDLDGTLTAGNMLTVQTDTGAIDAFVEGATILGDTAQIVSTMGDITLNVNDTLTAGADLTVATTGGSIIGGITGDADLGANATIATTVGSNTLTFGAMLTAADNLTVSTTDGALGLAVQGDTVLANMASISSTAGDQSIVLDGALTAGDDLSITSVAGSIFAQVALDTTIGERATITTQGGSLGAFLNGTLTAGNDLTASTAGGNLSLGVVSDAVIGSNASLDSANGSLSANFGGTLTVAENLATNSDAGSTYLSVTGDTVIGDMASFNATSGNVVVDIDGTLTAGNSTTIQTDTGLINTNVAGAVTLGDTAQIVSNTGDINVAMGDTLTAGADLTVATIGGSIRGDITGDTDLGANATISTTVGASTLLFGAMLTAADNLTVSTTDGDLNLTVAADTTLGDMAAISSTAGNIRVDIDGSLSAGDLAAVQSDTGNIIIGVAGATVLGEMAAITSNAGNIDLFGRDTFTSGNDLTIATTGGYAGVNISGDAILGSDTTVSTTVGFNQLSVGGTLTAGDNLAISTTDGRVNVAAAGDTVLGDMTSFTSTAGDQVIRMGAALTVGDQFSITSGTGSVGFSAALDATIGDTASLTTQGGNLSTNVGGKLTVGNDLIASTAGGDLRLNVTSDMLVGTNASLNSAGGLNDAMIGGTLTAGDMFAMNSDAGDLQLTVQDDTLLGDMASLTSTTGDQQTYVNGTLTVGDNLTITSDTGRISIFATEATTIGDAATITTDGTEIVAEFIDTLTIGNDLTMANEVGNLTVIAGSDTAIGTNAALSTNLGDLSVTVGGTLTADNNLSISSDVGALDLTVAGNTVLGDMASLTSTTGNQSVDLNGVLTAGDQLNITSQTGLIDLAVASDASIGDEGRIVTNNATADALKVTIGGELSVGIQTAAFLEANETGAKTVLDIQSIANDGPIGIRTKLAELDATVRAGDMHFDEADGLIIDNATSENGNVDIYSNGETIVRNIAAIGTGDKTVVITAQGDLLADNAAIDGALIKLFALDGKMAGETTDSFTADTVDGAELWLVANNRLGYTETAGDLRVALASSTLDDLALTIAAGGGTFGILGAALDLTLTSTGDLNINLIGDTEIDLADEVGLKLVDTDPTTYGLYQVPSPQTMTLTATDLGASITVGLANIGQTASLYADEIDANLYDVTPDDNLTLNIADANLDFAEDVTVDVIGDGQRVVLLDPFASVKPLETARLLTPLGEQASDATSDGVVTLAFGRIGQGSVTTTGPQLIAQDVVLKGDTWFRQRSFDLLAGVDYTDLSVIADAQALALEQQPNGDLVQGKISFVLTDEIILTTKHVLNINRSIGGLDLNGGQGLRYEVGAEVKVKVVPLLKDLPIFGVTQPLFQDYFGFGLEEDEGAVKLPTIVSMLTEQ